MATLKNLVDETTNIKNEIVECRDNLRQTLVEKGVECSDSDKMSSLIDKVDSLGDYDNTILYLYKDGDECIGVTGGLSQKSNKNNGSSKKNSDNIELLRTGAQLDSAFDVIVGCNNLIDITNYKTLNIEVATTGSSSFAKSYGAMIKTEYSFTSGTVLASIARNEVNSSKVIYSVDISDINGLQKIMITFWGNQRDTLSVKFYKIWLGK